MAHQARHIGPVATRMLFENDAVKVWEMDVAAGEEFAFHRHTMDYVLYILAPALLTVHERALRPFPFDAKERAVYFIPGGGAESFINNGPGPFREVLIELKRKPRPSQDRPGYTLCEAMVGQRPTPGTFNILENDRVIVAETILEPRGETALRPCRRDTAIFVIAPGLIDVVERPEDGRQRTRIENRERKGVYWQSRGPSRRLINRGESQYRQISLELK